MRNKEGKIIFISNLFNCRNQLRKAEFAKDSLWLQYLIQRKLCKISDTQLLVSRLQQKLTETLIEENK